MFKCECGFKLNHEPKRPFYCKCGRKYRGPGAAETPADIRPVIDRQRAHWHELHTTDPTPAWFDDWQSRIPNIGCDCRKHWKDWVAANPPDFANFFAWTVAAHNAVNARLGKPLMSVEEARAQHDIATTP